jgi:hypothetical protein
MEKYSFDFLKMKFESTNPGDQSKSTLKMLMIFFVVVLIIISFGFYFFNRGTGILSVKLLEIIKLIFFGNVIIKKCKIGNPP